MPGHSLVKELSENCGATRGPGRRTTSPASFAFESHAKAAAAMGGSPSAGGHALCNFLHPSQLLGAQVGAKSGAPSFTDAPDDHVLRYGQSIVAADTRRRGRLDCRARHTSRIGAMQSSRLASGSPSDSRCDRGQRVARRPTRALATRWLDTTGRSLYVNSPTLEVFP